MLNRLPKVYWDSCVFIDWLQKSDKERIALIEPVIIAAVNQQLIIVTSALTLAEVIRTEDGLLPEEDEAKIISFFKQPYISVRNVDRRVAQESRILCRQKLDTGKKLPVADAIHVATAKLFGVPVIHTFDEKHLIPFHEFFGTPAIAITFPSYTPPTEEYAPSSAQQTIPFGDEDDEVDQLTGMGGNADDEPESESGVGSEGGSEQAAGEK